MDVIIIALFILWVILAIRYVKKNKNGCSGNCLSCLSQKKNIKKMYDRDYKR